MKLSEQLIAVDKQLDELFAKKAALAKQFHEELAGGVDCLQNPDGTWTRVAVADNLAELTDKERLVKIQIIERYSVKIDVLKNMPKELKAPAPVYGGGLKQ